MENIPSYLVEACKSDSRPPNKDRIGVTELINPPLQRTLYLENWDKIKRDPIDSVWMILGSGLDEIVKKHSRTALTKLKLEWNTIHGITVVAIPDLVDVTTGVLADLKVTSVWSVRETKKEYEEQLNLYDYLLWKNHIDLWKQIKSLEIHAILRDWRRNEKLRYNDYPKSQFVVLPIRRWLPLEQEELLDLLLQDHLKHPDRECTNEEKWQKQDQYACYKNKNKTASRVLDSQVEAENWIEEQKNPKEFVIQKRPGECVRCLNYCSVSEFCKYAKNIK